MILGVGTDASVIATTRQFGTQAVGIEIDPLRFVWCQILITILGCTDSRLWRFESTYKYLIVLWLALAFLEYQQARGQPSNLAAVIRNHRRRHARKLVEEACALVLQLGDIAPMLARFTVAA